MKCISEDDERKLWESGVLRTDTPTELLNYVLFYNGKNLLTWRRGALVPQKLSQLHCEVVTVTGKKLIRYMYAEHGSKNHRGGFKLLHLGNKIVHQFENPEASRCDHVRILDLYFAKLSRDTFTFEKNKHLCTTIRIGGQRPPKTMVYICAHEKEPAFIYD